MGDSKQILVIVSGLSGAGKTTALHALEDLGYYCVDNLPAALLQEFARQIKSNPERYGKVALGIDARSRGSELARIPAILEQLSSDEALNCQLLFLSADDKILIKRFSETRRRHPLTTADQTLPEAIKKEQELLSPLITAADWVVDSSDTNIHQLRRQVWKCIDESSQEMTIVMESFAFKRGVPQDVDFVFDARSLPNPYWVPELREYSGLDQPIKDWLGGYPEVGRMADDIFNFLANWLPSFQDTQRSYVTVGIGCTGGRHRSVFLVESLAPRIRETHRDVMVHHREIQK